MSRSASISAVAAAMILLSGLLHGVQTGQWSGRGEASAAGRRIHSVPRSIDGWTAEELPFDARQLQVAEATGAFARRYERTRQDPPPASDSDSGGIASDPRVDVMLLCGPHGPVSVHPPTLCFTAAGYTQVTPERKVAVSDGSGGRAEFWTADFDKTVGGASYRMRTYWSWCDGATWSAPDNPRFAFAGTPVLHKLYASRMIATSGEASEESLETFLERFLPAVKDSLFRAATPAA